MLYLELGHLKFFYYLTLILKLVSRHPQGSSGFQQVISKVRRSSNGLFSFTVSSHGGDCSGTTVQKNKLNQTGVSAALGSFKCNKFKNANTVRTVIITCVWLTGDFT